MAGKRWTGSLQTDLTTKSRWTGTLWTALTTAKRWTGSAWEDLFPGGGGGLPTGSWTGGNYVDLTTSCVYTGGAGCEFIRQLPFTKTFTGTYVSFSIPTVAGITITSVVGTTVTGTASALRGTFNSYVVPLTLTNGTGDTIVPLYIDTTYDYEDLSGDPGDPGNEVP